MTISAGTVFSTAGKWTSSLVVAFALLSVWPLSCPAGNGQTAGPAPGGLTIPPLTDGTPGKAETPPPPRRRDVPREDIVSGTGQSFGGYIGTRHDPVRNETVTTIIAPRQPMVQQPPMYIAPQVYPPWDGNWSQGGGQYAPSQWPSHRPPFWDQGQRPPRPPHWDQHQRPHRPPHWDQHQRPHRPPHWGQGQRPPRPPHWEQGQRPPRPPQWQGGGIPPSWRRESGR